MIQGDALRKKYLSYLVVCSNATPGRITQLAVATRVGRDWFYAHCASRPLVAPARGSAQNEMQLHEFQATALSGRHVDFASFAGKPVLFVNVARE